MFQRLSLPNFRLASLYFYTTSIGNQFPRGLVSVCNILTDSELSFVYSNLSFYKSTLCFPDPFPKIARTPGSSTKTSNILNETRRMSTSMGTAIVLAQRVWAQHQIRVPLPTLPSRVSR